ncbi:MAG TPA: zinc ABC transporter substrate-binding protein AdcA, partial [Enterococcus sp.]|nr:zinc ABC transporter substrate-binding protein AdcA [Enterococcus sp.]
HEHGEEGHTHEHELDPHVWLAPSLAIKQAASIRDQLIEAYPEKQEVWTKNAAAYTEKLQALHQLYL